MSSFVKNNLKLISQGLTGGRVWQYTDTGALADIVDVSGYFTQAGDMGVVAGDLILINATDGGTTYSVRSAGFYNVQDTGATQGSVGPGTMIGDTG